MEVRRVAVALPAGDGPAAQAPQRKAQHDAEDQQVVVRLGREHHKNDHRDALHVAQYDLREEDAAVLQIGLENVHEGRKQHGEEGKAQVPDRQVRLSALVARREDAHQRPCKDRPQGDGRADDQNKAVQQAAGVEVTLLLPFRFHLAGQDGHVRDGGGGDQPRQQDVRDVLRHIVGVGDLPGPVKCGQHHLPHEAQHLGAHGEYSHEGGSLCRCEFAGSHKRYNALSCFISLNDSYESLREFAKSDLLNFI